MDDMEYLVRRERQERAAAKRAPCSAARAAHQQMAQLYALQIAQLQKPASVLKAA